MAPSKGEAILKLKFINCIALLILLYPQENLCDKPAGVPRLVALPLSDEERYIKFRNGRVNKNYRKQQQQHDHRANVKAGIFIEKGNFTYKMDANSDEKSETESVIGIIRNKPHVKVITRNRQRNAYENHHNFAPPPPVNINMNWTNLIKEVVNCVQATQASQGYSNPPPIPSSSSRIQESPQINTSRVQPQYGGPPKNDDLQLKIAATDLFDYLVNKREKERIQKDDNAAQNVADYRFA
jgi:hypothetical protein